MSTLQYSALFSYGIHLFGKYLTNQKDNYSSSNQISDHIKNEFLLMFIGWSVIFSIKIKLQFKQWPHQRNHQLLKPLKQRKPSRLSRAELREPENTKREAEGGLRHSLFRSTKSSSKFTQKSESPERQ